MGIFDSIKNAFGGKEEPDVTVSPSQMLRDAGIDPGGLKFGFGNRSITVSGEIADEGERQKILDVLSGAAGISTVQDNLVVAAPAPATAPAAADPAADKEPEPAESSAGEAASEDSEQKTKTVQSGDTQWKKYEHVYGNGSL